MFNSWNIKWQSCQLVCLVVWEENFWNDDQWSPLNKLRETKANQDQRLIASFVRMVDAWACQWKILQRQLLLSWSQWVGLGPSPGFLLLSLTVITDISAPHYQRQILNLSQFNSLVCLEHNFYYP